MEKNLQKWLEMEKMSHILNHGHPEYDGDIIAPGAFNKAQTTTRQKPILHTHSRESWINDKQALPGFYRGFGTRILCEDYSIPLNECHVNDEKIIMHPETLLSFVTQEFGSDQALKLAWAIMQRRIDSLFKIKPYPAQK